MKRSQLFDSIFPKRDLYEKKNPSSDLYQRSTAKQTYILLRCLFVYEIRNSFIAFFVMEYAIWSFL